MSSPQTRTRRPRVSPRIGALLRLAWQQVRERIDEGVRAGGCDDLHRAHLALFRYEGLNRVAVDSSSSGRTRTLPITDMKLVSPFHRGTRWMCT